MLQDFEDGLLRLEGLEGDELTAYLDKYAQRMSASQTQAIKDSLKGATPPSCSNQQTASKSVQDLRADVNNAAPNSDESRTAWTAYKEALRAQS